ncbi:Tic22 family protein [Leptothermofonsia sp. ETS-13]|uniref:Tic22 family protein n=1 Tax=Leptothermofonsia sp. ETS-13 TaxID=3035696 RepID=UPI003BA34BE4
MKSFVRWSATVGLVGSALLGSVLAGATRVLALPKDQILQKLRPVPVFTIANSQGAPLVASPPQGQKGQPVAGVFISQKDAQAFLDSLKTKNPELAKGVSVVPVSLAEVYQLNLDNKGKPDGLGFAFVPSQQQVASATSLLKQSGQQVQQFNGTPLFVARGGKEKGYLTIQDGNKTVIPMFFKKEELQALLDKFKQQQPNLASTVEIQVLNLEGLIQVLQEKNDPQLTQIVLVPSQESIEYVRSLSAPGQKPAPAAKPAPAPKK